MASKARFGSIVRRAWAFLYTEGMAGIIRERVIRGKGPASPEHELSLHSIPAGNICRLNMVVYQHLSEELQIIRICSKSSKAI